MRAPLSSFALLASLVALVACPAPNTAVRAEALPASTPAAQTAARPAPVRAPATRTASLVSPAWLAAHLGDPGLVVLHVGQRPEARYAAGHVPGARFLSLEALLVQRPGAPNELPTPEAAARAFEAAGVSDDSEVILYGDRDGIDAARAYFTLDWLGQRRHALLDGGLEAWRTEGRPTPTAVPTVRAGTLTARLRPDLVVSADWVRANAADPSVVILDARPPAQYAAGHIPGARSFFWKRGLRPGSAPRVEPLEELRRALAQVAPEGRTVVTYCNSGMMASYLYFLARHAGYQARLYDGSFEEWVALGYPVARDATPSAAR